MTTVVTIDGSDRTGLIDLDNSEIEEAASGLAGVFSFVLRDPALNTGGTALTIREWDEAVVTIDGDPAWGGYCLQPSPSYDGVEVVWSVSAASYDAMLDRRIVSDADSQAPGAGDSDATWVAWLVGFLSDLGFTTSNVETLRHPVGVTLDLHAMTIRKALDKLAAVIGARYWVDASKDVHWTAASSSQLVVNGHFDVSLSGWEVSADTSRLDYVVAAHGGVQVKDGVLRIVPTGSDGSPNRQTIAVTAGTRYAFRAQAQSDTAAKAIVELDWQQSGGSSIRVDSFTTTGSTDWVPLETVLVAPALAAKVVVTLRTTTSSPANSMFNDVYLVEETAAFGISTTPDESTTFPPSGWSEPADSTSPLSRLYVVGANEGSAALNDYFVTLSGRELRLNGQGWQFTGMAVMNAASRSWNGSYGYVMNTTDLGAIVAAMTHDTGFGFGRVMRVFFTQKMTVHSGVRDWTAFDEVIAVANLYGIKIVPVLGDHTGAASNEAHNSTWYTTTFSGSVESGNTVTYKAWVKEVAARYADEHAIAWWDLTNRVETITASTVSTWADTCAAEIRKVDLNHLVGVGNGTANGYSSANFETINDGSNIDVLTAWDVGNGWDSSLAGRNTSGVTLSKPLVVIVAYTDNDFGTDRADSQSNSRDYALSHGASGHLAFQPVKHGQTIDSETDIDVTTDGLFVDDGYFRDGEIVVGAAVVDWRGSQSAETYYRGATGFEGRLADSSIDTMEKLRLRAGLEFARRGLPTRKGKYSTRRPGLRPGDVQIIENTLLGRARAELIVSVTTRFVGNSEVRYEITYGAIRDDVATSMLALERASS